MMGVTVCCEGLQDGKCKVCKSVSEPKTKVVLAWGLNFWLIRLQASVVLGLLYSSVAYSVGLY